MSVDDHGLEVLRKSGVQVNAGDKAEYYIRVKDQELIDAVKGESGFADPILNKYGEISSLANSVESLIVSYTVPASEIFKLSLIEFSGENIAKYIVLLNDVKIAQKRTYFGGNLYGQFDFGFYDLTQGDKIDLKVEHNRPQQADFEGRILGVKTQ